MPDIEDRLRTGLATLADEVAPSEDPRAGLERRLTARRRVLARRPALTAAAAAVVVAAVFVPVVAGQDAPPSAGPAASSRPTAPAGEELPTLGTVAHGGRPGTAIGYLQGGQYCTTIAWSGDRTHRLTCEPVPDWPAVPGGSLVQSRELLNGDPADDTGMLAQRLVFLTDPRVATLTVRRGDGTAVAVTELDRDEHAAAFLADFAGPPDGFGYTARDSQGTVLEEAIT
jgi:hypothetical protein